MRARKATLRVVALVACGAVIVGATQASAGSASSRRAPIFSTTQLIQGFMFDAGPAARYFWPGAPLPRSRPLAAAELRERQELLRYLTKDASFSRSFRAEVQSGNPMRLEDAFASLASRLQAFVISRIGPANFETLNILAKRLAAQRAALYGHPDYRNPRETVASALHGLALSALGETSTARSYRSPQSASPAHATAVDSTDAIQSIGTLSLLSTVFNVNVDLDQTRQVFDVESTFYDEDTAVVSFSLGGDALAAVLAVFVVAFVAVDVFFAANQRGIVASDSNRTFETEQIFAHMAARLKAR